MLSSHTSDISSLGRREILQRWQISPKSKRFASQSAGISQMKTEFR